MWLALAFVSATFLGLYDTSKKASLKDNAVLPVLLLNTIFSTIIFLPFLIDYVGGFGWFAGTFLDTAPFSFLRGEAELVSTQQLTQSACMAGTAGKTSIWLAFRDLGLTHPELKAHLLVVLKAFIVLSSWICGYFGLKHLPLTIVGPINATRPVLVLVGAMLIFGERLNAYQWVGVILAIASIFLMSRAGKKENIDFKRNKWIWCVGLATLMGVISGLYDKHIMKSLNPMFVQSWFNFYQMIIMTLICVFLWYPKRHTITPFTCATSSKSAIRSSVSLICAGIGMDGSSTTFGGSSFGGSFGSSTFTVSTGFTLSGRTILIFAIFTGTIGLFALTIR